MPPAEEGRVSGKEASGENISDLLPLGLVRAQLIPPAPNHRESAIDFLPDFGGASWIAYGAASLLVVSHFPSPLSPHEVKAGPLFRQVIEIPPPSDAAAAPPVNAVSWCPSIPSEGEIAAAAGSCIWMYSPVPTRDGSGSFCWKQAVALVENFIIDTIKWTGSGDGLIVAGIDVVLWVRKEASWEMTWRSRAKVPQVLVSATWLAEGPVATAAHTVAHCNGTNTATSSSFSGEEYKHVFVYLSDGKSGLTKVQLGHPQPISMIQWRPFARAQSEKDTSPVWRNVLLSCCLDGTVRLWSENEIGRPKKLGKDAHDPRSMRRSFNVIAVIEVNKCSKGMLGKDIFVKWAVEFGGVISKGEGDRYDLWPSYFVQHQVGKCEWLIGIGPNFSVTFWAIHCLDDVSPARFPRVTLWGKQNLMDLKTSIINCNSSNSEIQPILIKVIASRRFHFGSPDICSLLQLLPDNSVTWSMLYRPISDSTDNVVSSKSIKERSFSFAGEVLNQDGHTGIIRQVCVHPRSSEIELAVSLDSDGLLLFWSLSTLSTFTWNLQTILHPHPLLKPLGRIYLGDLSSDIGYSCLSWAPSILDENRFLLLGSENGVDCFIIRVPGKGENVPCQKILTIPYGVGKNGEGPPDHVFSTPLASSCGKSLLSSSFLLFCIWRKKFQALSWKVVLHCGDPDEGYCGCGFDAKSISVSEERSYVSYFEGKMYFAKVYVGSSVFPSPQESDQTTSSAIVSTNKAVPSLEQSSYNDSCNTSLGYHLVTGCSDGTLKLWKMSCEESSFHSQKEILSWDLIGMLTAHQGPVTAISLSSCGCKIATVSTSIKTNNTSLHIWEPVCLMDGGSFLFEDEIILQDTVVGLRWVSLGNGRLLLGVCLPNELRIYCHRRPSSVNLVHSQKSKEMHFWDYIAVAHSYPAIKEFFWGPKMTPVLVHEKHLSLFSQWLFRTDITDTIDHSITYSAAVHEDLPSTTNIDGTNIYKVGSSKSSNISVQQNDPNFVNRLFNLMDIVDMLGGPLALYHPEALLQHLYSGNWKRAQIVLQHLADSIRTSEASTTNMECNGLSKSGHIIPEIHLSNYFMDNISTNCPNKVLQWGENSTSGVSDLHFHANILQDVTSQRSEVIGFTHTLDKSFDVAAITDIERVQILGIVDLLVELNDSNRASAYKSLDEPGRRFWVGVQFQRHYFLRKCGDSAAADGLLVDSASLAWAVQSDCQDDLLNSLLSSEPTWPEMRNLGVGLWYTNVTQLRTKMEKLARLQYLKNKDPKECALLYLALNRRQVLAGLFKLSKNEKDKPLFGFLSRNFQEEKNKAAALKNAYVLMGRHQLELAIAFFLLGNDPSSAVTLCAKNLGDEQLALIICRLVEGYGGPLEHHLISNILLPNAIEKEDYWLSSVLEWTLGNFSQSAQKLLEACIKTQTGKSSPMGCRPVCSDPKIGQYCVTLSTKNNFKNSVGDGLAAKLSKLSTSLAASALNRIGLPLEALECLSSNLGIGTKDQGSSLNVGDQIFQGILNPFPGAAPNWLSRDVAMNVELNAKLNMASEYMSHFLIGHPQWPKSDVGLTREVVSHKEHGDLQIGEIKHDVEMAISVLEEKFSLKFLDLAAMIVVFACNKGLLFLPYLLFHANKSPENGADNCGLDGSSFTASHTLFRLLLKANEEICYSVARFIVSCNFTDSTLKLVCSRNFTFENDYNEKISLPKLIYLLRISRSVLKHCNGGISANKNTLSVFAALDLLEYFVEFAYAWLQKDIKGLIMMIIPILNASVNGSSSLVIIDELMTVLHQRHHDASRITVKYIPGDYIPERQLKNSENSMLPIDEKWHLIGACLWIHLLTFMKNHLDSILGTEMLQAESSNMNKDLINMFPFHVVDLVVHSLNCVASSLIKQFGSFIKHKMTKNFLTGTLFWLDKYDYSQAGSLNNCQNLQLDSLLLSDNEDKDSLFNILWKISVNPQDICASFANERVNYFPHYGQKLSVSWKDVEKSTSAEYEIGASENGGVENEIGSTSPNFGTGRISTGRGSEADDLLEARRKHPNAVKETSYFHNPRELIKRNGELFEATCFNSLNEQQVAVASNRKGLLFFNWNGERHFKEQTEYIWSESDWPPDGWAGYESTPIPTCVSPGIGLGSKRGAHLGLGRATAGLGSLARPRKDLTGGGAFGIPGYAGIGASGLGWGEQEDFEEYVDPPATVENVHSRALSRHPTRPFLLVGSSNTHAYLWEFGKDRALATYGVLPAANVPPPYALASVCSLQFDYYGHRFATAALDGTVSTWQLEVGGRSNVHPLDSSLCFNSHASGVAYVSGSGSILAAAGCSSNNANVIIWDTLAPPATCQASVICHEGGARSLSVFDNDIGSGSISPIIVTGGKNGDVGLHDFRYIATGKTKRHKNCSEQDLKSTFIHDMTSGAPKVGDSSTGMIWYIPKAHLGSVTRISTIPNTSLFLTGSKDGDVKLWDAKRSQLVFHWQKLHDRHTFFQPNSRGFGGVVRAAVTDIQVLSHGFLTCGGDGSVKLIELK